MGPFIYPIHSCFCPVWQNRCVINFREKCSTCLCYCLLVHQQHGRLFDHHHLVVSPSSSKVRGCLASVSVKSIPFLFLSAPSPHGLFSAHVLTGGTGLKLAAYFSILCFSSIGGHMRQSTNRADAGSELLLLLLRL